MRCCSARVVLLSPHSAAKPPSSTCSIPRVLPMKISRERRSAATCASTASAAMRSHSTCAPTHCTAVGSRTPSKKSMPLHRYSRLPYCANTPSRSNRGSSARPDRMPPRGPRIQRARARGSLLPSPIRLRVSASAVAGARAGGAQTQTRRCRARLLRARSRGRRYYSRGPPGSVRPRRALAATRRRADSGGSRRRPPARDASAARARCG
mmetsp:Transcript_31680/g.99584  ORF Transcript_31680/g.99584 Transcript_31680/m.99584 type:complete len:209 (-) Transcript_31680:113-739(-)